MRVMIIGSGGREHALAWAVARSPRVTQVLCVPGNAGTAGLSDLTGRCAVENVKARTDDHRAIVEIARERNIDLTIVGPEGPLCAGIVDKFHKAGLRIFGPSAAAARIEGDKAYAKRLMVSANVPTAEARIFDRYDAALSFVRSRETGLVVKAAGLAAGKGVFVCQDPDEAAEALKGIMVDRVFAAAGDTVIVEELLKGEELSVLALVDGNVIYTLETAQDHKRIGEGDTGQNTGGMGGFSPAGAVSPQIMRRIESEILVPIVDALRNDDAPYRGVLYAGLMLTPGGPKVLEFNCRFGDPEAQAILVRLESDPVNMFEAVVEGRLDETDLRWRPDPAVCVVMASGGYPGRFQTGKVIHGLEQVRTMPDVFVFHAGTEKLEHLVITSGGRVLAVTALAATLEQARDRAYAAVEAITFEDAYYRRDIAERAIKTADHHIS